MTPLPPPWQERQADFASLLNPFFIGALLWEAASAYRSKEGVAGLPFALAFVIPAMVLHPTVARARPQKTSRKFVKWVRENPVARAELALVSRLLGAQVREAIAVLMAAKTLSIQGDRLLPTGALSDGASGTRSAINEYLEDAAFCARWLATAGSVSAIYEAIGIRP